MYITSPTEQLGNSYSHNCEIRMPSEQEDVQPRSKTASNEYRVGVVGKMETFIRI
jgi:hypothetical protein